MSKEDTSWNDVADWYDELVEENDSFQRSLILPNILRLAGDINKKKILDVACGQGFFSYEFQIKGADVTGVDVSKHLIDIARKKAPLCKFFEGSAEKIPSAVGEAYDVAICILAMQNIRNINSAIAEISRVLKKGGKFMLVLNHPAFRVPKRSSWGYDDKENLQFRRIDRYMSESEISISMKPSVSSGPVTVSFHRPLQIYFKSLSKNSLAVEKLEEWISNKESQEGPRKEAEDRARKEFPLFLYIGAVKL